MLTCIPPLSNTIRYCMGTIHSAALIGDRAALSYHMSRLNGSSPDVVDDRFDPPFYRPVSIFISISFSFSLPMLACVVDCSVDTFSAFPPTLSSLPFPSLHRYLFFVSPFYLIDCKLGFKSLRETQVLTIFIS